MRCVALRFSEVFFQEISGTVPKETFQSYGEDVCQNLPCIDLWQNDKTIISSQRLNSSYTSVVPDMRSEHDAWKMRHFLVPEPVLLRDMVNKRQKKHKQQRWFGFGCFFFWCVLPCPSFRLRLVLFRLVDLAESGSITQPELEFLMTQVREEKPGEWGGFFVG